MDERKGADPKLILAVQMLSIGVILFILGLIALIITPLRSMTSFMRTAALLSYGSIIFVGFCFAVGGMIRYRRVKKK